MSQRMYAQQRIHGRVTVAWLPMLRRPYPTCVPWLADARQVLGGQTGRSAGVHGRILGRAPWLRDRQGSPWAIPYRRKGKAA